MLDRRFSTKSIVEDAVYLDGESVFFKELAEAIDVANCQIVKLETRQEYDEGDSKSYQAFIRGDISESRRALEKESKEDAETYKELKARNVEICRCRPIAKPLTDYLRWELMTYSKASDQGESIFVINQISSGDLFSTYALHDFMVIDARHAFVHNYDQSGSLKGGWRIENQGDIDRLISLFSIIKANSLPYRSVYENGID